MNFKELKILNIKNLKLESDQIKYIKSFNNLEILYCYNGFKYGNNKMINTIELNSLELKTFTEQDAFDYCLLNNINTNDIKLLNLGNNKLTDISGIKLFKNLEELWLNKNNITDIFVLKNLKKLKFLGLYKNLLTDISVLKDLINLKELVITDNEIKDISVLKDLNKLNFLDIRGLKLESDQIQYIKFIKNLKELRYEKGFKDMSVLNQLNKNIKVYL